MNDHNKMFAILSVPEPCSEDWDAMEKSIHGVYCAKCTENVVDFSTKSDEEIIAFMHNNKDSNICGRFQNSQLHRILNSSISKSYRNLAISTLIAGMSVVQSGELLSAEKDSLTKNKESVDCDSVIATNYYYIGHVLDEEGQPISDANIYYSPKIEEKQPIAKTNKDFLLCLQKGQELTES